MKLKALLLAAVVACGVLVGTAMPAAAVRCPAGSERENEDVNSYAECSLPKPDPDKELVPTVVHILNVIVGVMAVVTIGVMIVGGVFFVLSQGDAAKITRARNTILYGLVGLVVSLLSFAIVNFVVINFFRGDSGGSGAVTKPVTKPTGTGPTPAVN